MTKFFVHQFGIFNIWLLIAASLFNTHIAQSAEKSAYNKEWQPIAKENGIQIYRRNFQDSPLVGFKGETTYDISYERVFTVMADRSIRKSWVVGLAEIKVVQQNHPWKDIVEYLYMKMPWPITDRDLVNHLKVHWNPNQKTISAHITAAKPGMVPVRKDAIRARVIESHWQIQSIDNGTKTKITVYSVNDPGGWIPIWLVNRIGRNWPVQVLTKLEKLAKQKNLTIDPRFYKLTSSTNNDKR